MDNVFYGAAIFFFIFASAMLAGIYDRLSKIAKCLETLTEEKKTQE